MVAGSGSASKQLPAGGVADDRALSDRERSFHLDSVRRPLLLGGAGVPRHARSGPRPARGRAADLSDGGGARGGEAVTKCQCRPQHDETPADARWLPNDQAWVWTCEHGHEFIRRPHWERLYSLEELKERLVRKVKP